MAAKCWTGRGEGERQVIKLSSTDGGRHERVRFHLRSSRVELIRLITARREALRVGIQL